MIPDSYDPSQPAGQNSRAETPPSASTLQPETAASGGGNGGLPGQRTRHRVILGCDCSLVGTGLIAVPLDWEGDWKRIAFKSVGWSLPSGSSDRKRVERLCHIAETAVAFAAEHGATLAAIEGLVFGKVTAAHSLGEVSGAVRVALHLADVELVTAPCSTSRKLLLGKLPRKAAKLAVRDRLLALGAPFTSLDEMDAFAAANLVLRSLGAYHLAGAPLS